MYIPEVDTVRSSLDSVSMDRDRLRSTLDNAENDLNQAQTSGQFNDDDFGLGFSGYDSEDSLSGRASELINSIRQTLEQADQEQNHQTDLNQLQHDLDSIKTCQHQLGHDWQDADSNANSLVSDLSERLMDFNTGDYGNSSDLGNPYYGADYGLKMTPDYNDFDNDGDSNQLVDDLTSAKEDAEELETSINEHDLDEAKMNLSNLDILG